MDLKEIAPSTAALLLGAIFLAVAIIRRVEIKELRIQLSVPQSILLGIVGTVLIVVAVLPPTFLSVTPTPTSTNTPTPRSMPSVLRSEVVAIKTFHGRYVTAMDEDWNWELRAETATISDWEKFVLLYLDNGKVALKTYHGRFASATDDIGCCNWVLIAEAKERGICEEFTLVDLGNGRVAFETCYGRYVTALNAERCWILRAETQTLGAFEEFTIVPQ